MSLKKASVMKEVAALYDSTQDQEKKRVLKGMLIREIEDTNTDFSEASPSNTTGTVSKKSVSFSSTPTGVPSGAIGGDLKTHDEDEDEFSDFTSDEFSDIDEEYEPNINENDQNMNSSNGAQINQILPPRRPSVKELAERLSNSLTLLPVEPFPTNRHEDANAIPPPPPLPPADFFSNFTHHEKSDYDMSHLTPFITSSEELTNLEDEDGNMSTNNSHEVADAGPEMFIAVSFVYNCAVGIARSPSPLKMRSFNQKWRTNMKVPEDFKPSRSSHHGICEQHFLKKCFFDFEQGSRLKEKAVPTLLQVGPKKVWRKVAPDYEALGEESVPTPEELQPQIQHDHTYLEGATEETLAVTPSKRKRTTVSYAAEDPSAYVAEIEELKRQVHSQSILIKRLEEKVRRRDSRKLDLDFAIDKLKSILQCCECGLKPSSEGELAKMLKRSKEDTPGKKTTTTTTKASPNQPTQVVCRNDLVVGLTWKQLFNRVNSMSQGE
ncbi:hypothetical protein BSL78_29401 [Apostichopus japonicus]|uniref:THAP-type domain-containing protein n=1 Tax=Stichopus japonicus TaxID=307972 RepID=A0A2G8JDG5_STIJA|nr:hypothetical protein BSL78_29401 [Apostichopus japonicus]